MQDTPNVMNLNGTTGKKTSVSFIHIDEHVHPHPNPCLWNGVDVGQTIMESGKFDKEFTFFPLAA